MTTDASTRDNRLTITMALAMASLLVALIAAGFGMRAIDESRSGVRAATGDGGGALATLDVRLAEMSIDAGAGIVASPGTLAVANEGALVHNLRVDGSDLGTPDLEAGGAADLSLAGLAAGTHTIYCSVPGHREAGMEASLTVGGAAAPDGGEDAEHKTMSAQEMDEPMAKPTKAFPAKTAGLGGQAMAPEVLADGTKQFELTAKVVAPGERYSVLIKADELGVWAWHCHILPHAERSTGMFGMVTAMIVQ